MKKVIFSVFLLLSFQACSFKKSDSATVTNADTGLPSSREARFDWQDDLNPQNQSFVKAKRTLVFNNSISASSSEIVTLPQSVPSPLSISVDNPSFNLDSLSFSKVYAVTDQMKTELKVTTTYAAGVINFKVELLPSVLSQAKSEKIQLELDLYGANDKILSYSFNLRTPPAAISFQGKAISQTNSNDYSIPTGLMQQTVNGQAMNLVSVIVATNNESEAVEVTLPQKLNAQISQTYTTGTYTYLGDCESTYRTGYYWTNYTYSSVSGVEPLASDTYLVPYDENTIQNLYLFASGNPTQTFSVKDIPASSSLTYLVYAKGAQLQSWEQKTAYITTMHTASHEPTRCFANEGNDSFDQIEYADFQVGDQYGQPFLHFNDSLNATGRYLDIDELKEEGNRSLPIATSDTSLIGG